MESIPGDSRYKAGYNLNKMLVYHRAQSKTKFRDASQSIMHVFRQREKARVTRGRNQTPNSGRQGKPANHQALVSPWIGILGKTNVYRVNVHTFLYKCE